MQNPQQVVSQEQPGPSSRDLFNRIIGGLSGRPDVVEAKATTVRAVHALVGDTETYIVQTFRDKEAGETVFIEHVSATGTVRVVLPPDVTEVIARQSYTISKRMRRSSAKESMRDRMAKGWKPNFQKKGEAAKATKRRRLKPTE